MSEESAPYRAAAELADAMAPMLVRRFRDQLYDRLQACSPVPVRDGTYPVLMALAQGPATASQAASRVGVDRTVAARQATLLEEAGLVARGIDEQDRRNTIMTLTDAGRRVANDMRDVTVRLLESALGDDVSCADLHTAARVLSRLQCIVGAGNR